MTARTKAMVQSAAMCCDTKSAVTDSRPNKGGSWRRRRVCQVCGRRWSTIEIAHGSIPGVDLDVIRGRLERMAAEIAVLMEYVQVVQTRELSPLDDEATVPRARPQRLCETSHSP